MDINCSYENQKLVVSLSGRLDSVTSRDLENVLKEKMQGASMVVFDLTNLEYLTSAGLRVLLASHKLMSGNMEIKNPNSAIMGIFEMTGMGTIFNITQG